MVGDNFYDPLYSRIGYIIDHVSAQKYIFFHVTFIIKNIHVDERRRCVNFISRGIRSDSYNHDLGVSDDSSTSSRVSSLKISTSEGPIFHVYLPHRPKSALGCADVLVSRFKMKIGPLILARCRDKKKKKPRASTPSGQRLVEEEALLLLVAPDVHIYHPLLLPGQTSGLTGRAQRPNPRLPPQTPEELRFAGAARCLLSPRERDESLTWQLPRKITDLTKDLHLGSPRLPKG